MASSREIYIVAAEYSAPPEVARVERVFATTKGDEPPALLPLMENAARRALAVLPAGARLSARVDHLLVTTMPVKGAGGAGDLRLSDDAMNLTGLLQRSLALPDRCVTRFELGSSDGGAALFASGVRLLQGVSEPTTALLVAGQVMPRGAAAIETVAQVIEVSERALGLRMIPVGDLLLDALWARLVERVGESSARASAGGESSAEVASAGVASAGMPSGESSAAMPSAGEGVADPTELAGRLAANKLRLATEYPAAMRRGGKTEVVMGRPLARWLHDAQVAQACNGACAVVLTTDEAVVAALVRAGHRRLVRVLGVGEGNDDPVLSRRTEPLLFLKAMRQSLVFLRRSVEAHVDFLRGSAFAVFHDAFPSIELGFLTAMGFDVVDAVERAGSYWANPYGGLTAFGHAMAASGMVQIAKAYHVLTRPAAYLPARVDRPSMHPDQTRSAMPIHCLTTSVGGPMTHVVASLLQSVPVPVDGMGELPAPFSLEREVRLPDEARRPDPGEVAGVWAFEGKVRWAGEQGAWFRGRCGVAAAEEGVAGVGVVVGRTRLDLRSVALPMAEGFLGAWVLPALVGMDGVARALPGEWAARLRQALRGSSSEEGRAAVERVVEGIVAWLADGTDAKADGTDAKADGTDAKADGTDSKADGTDAKADGTDGKADAAARRELRQAVHAALRPPVALIDGGGPGLSTAHALCLLPDESIAVGALVKVEAGPVGGLPWVAGVLTGARLAWVPPWYGAPGGDDRTPVGGLSAGEAGAVANLVRTLRAGPVERQGWVPVFEWAERAMRAMAEAGRPATVTLRRLAQTLMYAPDPDRWTIAEAFEGLFGVVAVAPPADELTGYVELDLWRAGDQPAVELARLFDTVEEAISRARGWLGGADLHVSRLGDTYAVIARRRPPAMSSRVGAELWPQVLRFARDVYEACLRRGAPLRVVVDVSTDGMPIMRREAYLGVAGPGPIGAHRVMMQAPHFRRRGAASGIGAGHGVAVVRYGRAARGADGALAGWAQDRWDEVGGLDGYVVDHARLDAGAFYHIAWRPEGAWPRAGLRAAVPFDARDDRVGVLCFSAQDGAAAGVLEGALAAAGVGLWAEEPVEAGGFWQREVEARAGSVVVVLWGADAAGFGDAAVLARVVAMAARGARVIVARLAGAGSGGWLAEIGGAIGAGGGLVGEVVEVPDPAAPAALIAALVATLRRAESCGS